MQCTNQFIAELNMNIFYVPTLYNKIIALIENKFLQFLAVTHDINDKMEMFSRCFKK